MDYWEGKISQVKTTSGYSLALDKEGRLFAWGTGEFGRLGLSLK